MKAVQPDHLVLLHSVVLVAAAPPLTILILDSVHHVQVLGLDSVVDKD